MFKWMLNVATDVYSFTVFRPLNCTYVYMMYRWLNVCGLKAFCVNVCRYLHFLCHVLTAHFCSCWLLSLHPSVYPCFLFFFSSIQWDTDFSRRFLCTLSPLSFFLNKKKWMLDCLKSFGYNCFTSKKGEHPPEGIDWLLIWMFTGNLTF